jgi:hypothetical protein
MHGKLLLFSSSLWGTIWFMVAFALPVAGWRERSRLPAISYGSLVLAGSRKDSLRQATRQWQRQAASKRNKASKMQKWSGLPLIIVVVE